MNSKIENRNSSLELLRIIAGVLIVIGHASSKGGGILGTIGANNVIAHIFAIGANLGSNLLAIIGFYFMIDSKFKFRSWLRIWFLTIYYYFGILIGGIVLAGGTVSANMIFKGLPIIGRPYWFVTAYLLFMLFVPFLNYGLRNISLTIMRKLVFISTIIFAVLPILATNATIQNDLTFFLWLYLVVYWLFYCEEKVWNKKILLLIGGGRIFCNCIMGNYSSKVLCIE